MTGSNGVFSRAATGQLQTHRWPYILQKPDSFLRTGGDPPTEGATLNSDFPPRVFYRPYNFCMVANNLNRASGSPALAALLQMPKSIRKKEEEEVAAYTARWLELADAALSATEKAAKALEIAREEQEHIRNNIKRRLDKYAKAGGRRVKRVG